MVKTSHYLSAGSQLQAYCEVFMCDFSVGEVVEFWVEGRAVSGNGTLVQILELDVDWAVVTTGCSQWPEKLSNLRKTS